MHILCTILLQVVSVWFVASERIVPLLLNPDATAFNEIYNITHNVDTRTVTINLTIFRRCGFPYFMVRMSGTNLYLLDLVNKEVPGQVSDPLQHLQTNYALEDWKNTFIYSYPPMIDEGTYFLEVLIVICNPIDPERLQSLCLEDLKGARNVVTLPYSFIVSASDITAVMERRPRWRLSNHLDKSTTATMLPTRYEKHCGTQFCKVVPEDFAQNKMYEWTDKPQFLKQVQSVLSLSHSNIDTIPANCSIEVDSIVVCLFGTSHERYLVERGNALKLRGVLFKHVVSHYSEDLDVNLFEANSCSYAVLGYGQWALSFIRNGHTPSVPAIVKSVRDSVHKVKNHVSETQAFMVSMNYNALGSWYFRCPAHDHRLPPIVDIYNGVTNLTAAEAGINYIDMNHIIGPQWDSAPDWGHPIKPVYAAEIEWILHHILQHTLTLNKPVPLKKGWKNNDLIRFSETKSVYLYKEGQIRNFPDGKTFAAMGYDFGDVKVFDELFRQFVPEGPPLHHL